MELSTSSSLALNVILLNIKNSAYLMQGWCYRRSSALSIVRCPCSLIISNPLFQTLLALSFDFMYQYLYSIAIAQFSKITCKEKGKKNVITFVHVNMSIQKCNQKSCHYYHALVWFSILPLHNQYEHWAVAKKFLSHVIAIYMSRVKGILIAKCSLLWSEDLKYIQGY